MVRELRSSKVFQYYNKTNLNHQFYKFGLKSQNIFFKLMISDDLVIILKNFEVYNCLISTK